MTSEPAPLLTNEEDYCTVNEALGTNENINSNVEPLLILDPSSAVQDDTNQSNRDLFNIQNHSVKNSRSTLNEANKVGMSLNNLHQQ